MEGCVPGQQGFWGGIARLPGWNPLMFVSIHRPGMRDRIASQRVVSGVAGGWWWLPNPFNGLLRVYPLSTIISLLRLILNSVLQTRFLIRYLNVQILPPPYPPGTLW